jgi:purine-binding chemotaxis protein CheW
MTTALIHRCCSFRIGDACFAVPADGVVEVLRTGRATRVPLAPAGILGLVHLRGRIVPVVDPAADLGIDRPCPERATLLVIALQEDWYAVVIDEMHDVLEIPADAIEHPAAGGDGTDPLTGIFAAPERLVHLLDPQRMIHSLVRREPAGNREAGSFHGRP